MDPQFELLRQRYRLRARERLQQLGEAVRVPDRPAIEELAHKLSGSGTTFGFPAVSRLAESLEHAVSTDVDAAELRRIAEPLLAELARIAQEG